MLIEPLNRPHANLAAAATAGVAGVAAAARREAGSSRTAAMRRCRTALTVLAWMPLPDAVIGPPRRRLTARMAALSGHPCARIPRAAR